MTRYASAVLLTLMAQSLGPHPMLAQDFPSGEDVAAEAMLRALAEKARNDAIVLQQLQQEEQRRQQEEQLRELEEAERRARTG